MDCCLKEYAEECEILVCVDAPALHNRTLYSRLRFGLLASSWLPSPLGIFLWSALHVMLLIVGGPIYWVLFLLAEFSFYTMLWFAFAPLVLSTNVVAILIALVYDLVCLLVESIRFCWSLVGFLAGHEPIVEWRGGDCVIVKFWKNFKEAMWNVFCGLVPTEAPCMSGNRYRETKNQKLKTWARWCEEVMHMHDAISV